MISEQVKTGILIVEDEPEIRLLLSEVFRIDNFQVYQAQDGQEAVRVFKENQDNISVVVTDLGLPNLGGIELIEMIRKMKPSLKIIGSSGYGRANVREEVLQAGGDCFIAKPYITTELIRTVKELLKSQAT
jgi:DNA-binding response OmpR family regulator